MSPLDRSATLTHPVEPDDLPMTWQENMYLSWHDPLAGIGGAHSVRLEVHNAGTAWIGFATSDGRRWRRNLEGVDLGATTHTPNRLGVASQTIVGEGGLRVEVDEPEVTARLEVTDLYSAFHPWPQSSRRTVQREAGHLEAAGRIRGRATLGDEDFEIDALCYRDHSWALADMSLILSHSWVAGTFGDELSWSGIIYQGANGAYMRGGSVVRHGEVIYADEVDIVIELEADGVSHRGGRITFYLPDGEEVVITATSVDGWVFQMGALVVTEAVCVARTPGIDRDGFCNFEVGTGTGQWRAPITQAFRATVDDGFSKRHPDRHWQPR